MKKVLIHYPFIPHYRVPVFNCLSAYKGADYSFEFISSKEDKVTKIKTDEDTWSFKHTKTKSFTLLNRFLFEFNILSTIIKEKPYAYVVLGNPNIITSWFYPLIARCIGVKSISWTHGALRREYGVKSFVRKLYLKLFNSYWLYGNRAVSLLKANYNIKSDKCNVIYNSLDYERQALFRERFDTLNYNEVCSRFNIPVDGETIITIGRLLPKLDLANAISYIAEVKKKYNKTLNLVIIGDGPELKRLKLHAKKLDLEKRVIFTGAIYEESDLSQLYFVATASLITGVVGLAAMHSLAYGVPVITHDNVDMHCPEVEALIESQTAYFYEYNNPLSTVNVLNSLAPKSNYSTSCIDIIELHYTPQKQLKYIIEALDALN